MTLAANHRQHARNGAILIVVLICLAVAGMLLVPLARRAGMVRHTQQTDLWSLQAQWLAEAGVERGAARLAADQAYGGETWRLSAADFPGSHEAEVRIRVRATDGRPGRWSIHVEADYPRAPRLRCRRVQHVDVDRDQLAPPRTATSSPENNHTVGETS